MSQQVETMKFQIEIYQRMIPTINAFYENKEIFSRTHLKLLGYM
jgi:HSP90 family molecular chaperone